ncbi:hypothetical protein BDV96DRAFT_142500 [Lophiotrema nucula]|uniref:Uncharacterized protein n=1 Tax=Lophiotrema nucula TaxID=690887 RepID=A0A6A5ZS66_9PLEO|nr:hypothetical protein BDV96DRAFT_142500 [Lophiotrema nucula]
MACSSPSRKPDVSNLACCAELITGDIAVSSIRVSRSLGLILPRRRVLTVGKGGLHKRVLVSRRNCLEAQPPDVFDRVSSRDSKADIRFGCLQSTAAENGSAGCLHHIARLCPGVACLRLETRDDWLVSFVLDFSSLLFEHFSSHLSGRFNDCLVKFSSIVLLQPLTPSRSTVSLQYSRKKATSTKGTEQTVSTAGEDQKDVNAWTLCLRSTAWFEGRAACYYRYEPVIGISFLICPTFAGLFARRDVWICLFSGCADGDWSIVTSKAYVFSAQLAYAWSMGVVAIDILGMNEYATFEQFDLQRHLGVSGISIQATSLSTNIC